jgi:Uma2 family endonuclease
MLGAVESADSVENRLTHHDLEQTPDDGCRWEVIDGVLHVTPLPTYAHENARTELLALLHAHARGHSLGRVFGGGLKVVLDEPTGVGPDVVFIRNDQMTGMQADGFHAAPELAVEVVSSKPQLDRDIKFRKYALAGIPHYWIVDPLNKALVAYRLDGDRYAIVADLEGDALFEPELFPGLVIPLASLWV